MYIGRTGPGLGIGYGIGTQAMAGIVGSGGTKTRARAALSGCCASCASGHKNCAAMSGLGAVSLVASTQLMKTAITPGVVTATPATSTASSGGISTLVKLALVAGVVGGGVFLYRKFKKS